MIEKLKWDSEFFGYSVGKIDFGHSDEMLLPDENEVKAFRLIYLFSDSPQKIKDSRISEVDIKTILFKKIGPQDHFSLSSHITEFDGQQENELKALALESGVYSRFKRDPKFTENEFSRLYDKWITDSINKKIADKVLVYRDAYTILGFVSLKLKAPCAEIGLIAVHENGRGKGIAMALLTASFYHTRKNHLPCISVVTQFENTPAMKLYQKAGFEIESKKYIYHLWNI